MNTLEQHDKQVNNALAFLVKAKHTNAANLQIIAGRTRRGFPTQLKRLGWVVSRDMGGGITVFGLSKKGADRMGVAQFDIHKLTVGRVQHGLIAQFETLIAVRDLGVIDFVFEPQDHSHETRPDAKLIRHDLPNIFLEVELSAKFVGDGELDRFFIKLLSRRTIVVFKDQMLLDRYAKAATVYVSSGIPEWERVNGKWKKTGHILEFGDISWSNIEFRKHRGFQHPDKVANMRYFGMTFAGKDFKWDDE